MAKSKKAAKKSKPRKAAKKAKPKKKTTTTKSRKTPAKSRSSKKSPEPAKAMRLTFSYDGDNVKLISQQRVDMVVPPSDPVKSFKKFKGFWADLKSKQDKTLFRRIMHNPTRNDAEVFPDTPGQSISRVPAPKRKGVFAVVVPATDKGDEVTLSRSAPEEAGEQRGLRALASKPAKEIMRFKLKK